MFRTNWKTSLAGVALVVQAGYSIVMAIAAQQNIPYESLAELVAGIGLLFAKDQNVTGGKTPNKV